MIAIAFLLALASAPATVAIVGGQVVDGTGAPPIADGVVLISGNRISAVGSAGTIAIPAGSKIVNAGGMTVMPGLIDMHVHLSMIGSTDADQLVINYHDREETEIMPAAARQFLLNGVTTVRDLGSPIEILRVRDRINRGEISGARLFVAGPYLHRRDTASVAGRAWHVVSVDDAREKVRQLAAAGVDWIKIHDQQDFSEEEVAAIAEEAARAHKPLAGHAYQNDAEVMRALKYHFKTLEHTGIGRAYEYSAETIRAIIGSDACIDPTLTVRTMLPETERFPARIRDPIAAETMPPDLYRHMVESIESYLHSPSADANRLMGMNIRRKMEPLIRGGACIVVGTDDSVPGLIHGSTTWYELRNFVELGMTPLEAITAATSRPGRLLAPGIGALLPGYHADVILVKGDVLADIGLLQNVSHVIKDGVQYK